MTALRVHEFMSLDGVVENPSWTMEFGFDPAMGQALASAMSGCTAILLGRTTYEMFAPAWSTRTASDDPGAPFFNDTEKYVVSATLSQTDWSNTTLLGGYDPEHIRKLKDNVDGDIYVSGSVTLVRALLDDGLVDGLHLFQFPLTLGTGPRLFHDGAPGRKLELAQSDTYPNGVVYLNYRPTS